MGIIGLDLSIESVTKAVALSLDPGRTPSDTFSGLLEQVDQLLEKAGLEKLPNKAHVLHVHSLRNDVQHKAKILSEDELSDSRTYARDFLEDVVRSVWGVSFDQISMVEIVRDEEVKARFHAAEAAFQNGEWLHAAEEAVTGLYSAIERVRRALVGRSSRWTTKGFVVEESFNEMKSDRDAWNAFQRMQHCPVSRAWDGLCKPPQGHRTSWETHVGAGKFAGYNKSDIKMTHDLLDVTTGPGRQSTYEADGSRFWARESGISTAPSTSARRTSLTWPRTHRCWIRSLPSTYDTRP